MANRLEKEAKKIIEIRCFEETVLRLFSENRLSGTTHTCIGEEATAVGVMEHIREEDKVFSNHRCHGHYLAYGGPKEKLLAEIMSKESGLCAGRGGSQHIHFKNFYSNGVQGGIVPNALGVAWADKIQNKDGVTVVFIGDGTLGQGLVYESFNMASIFEIPILFVIENNSYAMSTKTEYAVSGRILDRPKAFGIECNEIESTDVEELDIVFQKAFAYVRKERKPFCQVVHNYRLVAHSKGDDTRDIVEIEKHKKYDPMVLLEERIGKDFIDNYKDIVLKDLDRIVVELEKQGMISIEDYTREYEKTAIVKHAWDVAEYLAKDNGKVLFDIQEALDDLVGRRDDVVIIGEDIEDPYGGAFKVTKGLSTKYPGKVINTPISEASMTGAGVGLAINGMRPIVEIMFGDFISLCFDQLLNHAGKYGWVYGDNVSVPLVIRIPSGAGRGYGPTHSQSLEKFLYGIPYVNLVALNVLMEVKRLYIDVVSSTRLPVVMVENKKMYTQKKRAVENGKIDNFIVSTAMNGIAPTIKLSLDDTSKADVMVITYGGVTEIAMEASLQLMLEDEIQVDIIVLSQLSPFPMGDLAELLDDSIIVVLEEGNFTGGLGSEIIARLAENKRGLKYLRIAAKDIPIPNGIGLESQMMPTINTVVEKIKEIINA